MYCEISEILRPAYLIIQRAGLNGVPFGETAKVAHEHHCQIRKKDFLNIKKVQLAWNAFRRDQPSLSIKITAKYECRCKNLVELLESQDAIQVSNHQMLKES